MNTVYKNMICSSHDFLEAQIETVNPKESARAFKKIMQEIEKLQPVKKTKRAIYAYIGEAIINSIKEESMHGLKDINSNVACVIKEFFASNIFRKYEIETVYTFYEENQIWCITNNTNEEILNDFNQTTIGLLYDNRLDLTTMVFLIAKEDITLEDIPEYDDKIGV